MRKRLFAGLLSCILLLSLLPTSAFAAETDGGAAPVTVENTQNDLHLKKTVTPDQDGKYTVRLESYATGTVTASSAPVPLDIVLVLDQSGSMGKAFKTETASQYVEITRNKNNQNYYGYASDGNLWYQNSDGSYARVSMKMDTYFHEWWTNYTYSWDGEASIVSKGKWSAPSQTFYYKNDTTSAVTRLEALKKAANTFLASVAEKAAADNVDHRVAVVGFASNRSLVSDYENTELLSTERTVNYGDASAADYEDALVSANENGVNSRLTKAISRLDADGDTYSEYGIDMANKIFAQHPLTANEQRQRVIVLFTDGYTAPAGTNDIDYTMSDNAVKNADTAKKDYNAKVYTIGIFDQADPAKSITDGFQYNGKSGAQQAVAANRYMHYVSSNYEDVTGLKSEGDRVENSNFYLAASNATELNGVFTSIAGSIETNTTPLDSTARVVDTVPSNFTAPANAESVTLKVADYKKDGTFGTEEAAPAEVQATVGNGVVSVTGFDFSASWCGLDENDAAHGQKLIMEFTIACRNYGGTQPTNAGTSVTDQEGNPAVSVADPTVVVPVRLPDADASYTKTKTYDGTGFNVKNDLSDILGLVPVDGKNNAFIDLTYTLKDGKGNTVGTYTVPAGATTGDWSGGADILTPPYASNPNAAAGGDGYVYTVTVTGTDKEAAANSAVKENCTANYYIDLRPVTFTGESATRKYNGQEQELTGFTVDDGTENEGLVPGHTYSGLTYSAKGTDAGAYYGTFDDTNLTIVDAVGNDVTVNYAVSTVPGKLTIEASGEIEPEQEARVIFRIVGGTWDGTDDQDITVTVKLDADGNGTLDTSLVPTGMQAKPGYDQSTGRWDTKPIATVTGTGDVVYTYTFSQKETEPGWDWDVSKSKTATQLDTDTWTSDVTLSLPSAEEALISDVVFVLDGSSSANTGVVDESLALLRSLKASAGDSGAAVNVCVVKFKRQAYKSAWFDLAKDFDAIQTAMETKYSGGTNIHAGLLAGKEALEEHTDVPAGRKYLVLVSDGSTYLYSKDGDWASDTPFTRTYYTKENYTGFAGGYWDNGFYEPNNYPDVNVPRPKDTSDVAVWQAYLKDVEERNAESHGDDYDYHCNYDLNFNQGIPSEDFKSQPCEKRTANNRDMAFYYADQAWQAIKNAGYNAYSIATEDGSAGAGNADDSHCFMNYLNGGASLDFSDIRKELLYAVGKGSTVEDKMGAAFDFVPGSLKLTVGGKALAAKPDGDVTYFGDDAGALDENNYRFKVVYDGAEDAFTWTINENVSNFAPVQLTYTVKLTAPKTAAGTYTEPTNEYATLSPVDSKGRKGAPQDFDIPYVSYTVKSSGGHDGGDSDNDLYFAVKKIDAQDGHALNGATFALYQLDKDGRTVNRTVAKTRQNGSEAGIALFSVGTANSYGGVWYYAEVTAPEGYVLDTEEYQIKASDFTGSQNAAIKNAKTVRNYRSSTPDLLNDADHFAYVIGYKDGNVRPYGLISRAETTTIFFRLLKDEVRDGSLRTGNTYTDVPEDYWANTAISTMTGLGIVQGRSATTFDPKAPITRAQFAAICARFDTGKSSGTQTFSDIRGHWAEQYIQRAAELGWIKGFEDGTFRPDAYITRAQAMTMINRVLNRIPEESGDLLSNMNVWPDCTPGDWFYLAVQEATNSHAFKHKAGNYETWTGMNKDPDWTRYEH